MGIVRGIRIIKQMENMNGIKYNLALSKLRVRKIGRTFYLITSNYSDDKSINELLKKVMEREVE